MCCVCLLHMLVRQIVIYLFVSTKKKKKGKFFITNRVPCLQCDLIQDAKYGCFYSTL